MFALNIGELECVYIRVKMLFSSKFYHNIPSHIRDNLSEPLMD